MVEEIPPERMAVLRALGGHPGARERIDLTTAEADRLAVVRSYGTPAIDAALRDAIEGFRTAVRRQGAGFLSDAEVEFVTLAMTARMLTRATALINEENDGLRAMIMARGEIPDGEEEPPRT